MEISRLRAEVARVKTERDFRFTRLPAGVQRSNAMADFFPTSENFLRGAPLEPVFPKQFGRVRRAI